MSVEKTLKLVCDGGTTLRFTYSDGKLNIEKNNFYEVADLDDECVDELIDFLNKL